MAQRVAGGGLLPTRALDGAIQGDDAGAQGAIGLDDPGRRRLEIRMGPVYLLRHHVLGLEECDRGQRLEAALGLDHREVAQPPVLELKERLDAEVVAAPPLVEATVGAYAEDPALEHLVRGLEAVEHDFGNERARLLLADLYLRRRDERP